MKYLLYSLIVCSAAMTLASCSSSGTSYRVETDPNGTKVLIGKFTRPILEHDSAFVWFANGYHRYQTDSATMQALREQVQNLHFMLFLGTWCSDSKAEVPQMFKVFDELGIGPERIEMYGVDHLKKGTDDTPKRYDVKLVPTLIVYRGGKELGRIVEEPRVGIEVDLRRIVEQQH